MPGQEYDEVPIQQAEVSNYREYLIRRFVDMSDVAIRLRQSYTMGLENFEDHCLLVSILCELWFHLFPKMDGTDLQEGFEAWIPIVAEPKILFVKGYESVLWLFEAQICAGFEHLGLAKLK
jgi:hypothetical protein